MLDFSLLSEKFNLDCSADKFIVGENLPAFLEFLKNTPEYSFDVLTSIVANDLGDKIELIYQLYSTLTFNKLCISSYCVDSFAQSVVSVYKSAYFDECEIFDMFGVKFEGNSNLRRLYMPESWVGHPMLKSYELADERLAWNE